MTSYSLLTNIIDASHIKLLRRWLAFLEVAPKQVIAATIDGDEIDRGLDAFSKDTGIAVTKVNAGTLDKFKNDESAVLAAQFSASKEALCLILHLDTVVYKQGHVNWFSELLSEMKERGSSFATGTTKPFEKDQVLTNIRFAKTQRFSNNFAVIDKQFWFDTQAQYEAHKDNRYYVEWCIEQRCLDEGLWGLRCLNTNDWRVFHVQNWDERIELIQQRFEEGKGIEPFLTGYQEADMGVPEWEQYYMYPQPSLLKRLRVKLALGSLISRLKSR